MSRADLDSAAGRLLGTGLFTVVNYQCLPDDVDGSHRYSVKLIVDEEIARQPVVLDIPGVDSQQLWAQLIGTTLLDRVMPSQQAAVDYYVSELESFLSRQGHPVHLKVQDEIDSSTKLTVAVIQPADRPLVTDLRFEGDTAVSTSTIRERILKLVGGSAFSERQFRRILDLNVRPMFEERGLLAVAFPEVRATPGSGDREALVTTTIDQGRVWRLGRVTLEGDDIPADSMLAAGNFETGQVANWKGFLGGVTKMETVLKHDGFLDVSSKPVRTFQPDTGLVDVAIIVRKGTRYRFAAVDVRGLSENERHEVLSLWELKAGQPMDGRCIRTKFLKSVFERVHPSKKLVSVALRARPGTDRMDVIVTFK